MFYTIEQSISVTCCGQLNMHSQYAKAEFLQTSKKHLWILHALRLKKSTCSFSSVLFFATE